MRTKTGLQGGKERGTEDRWESSKVGRKRNEVGKEKKREREEGR